MDYKQKFIEYYQEFGEVQDAIHVLRLIADPIVYIESGCFVDTTVDMRSHISCCAVF